MYYTQHRARVEKLEEAIEAIIIRDGLCEPGTDEARPHHHEEQGRQYIHDIRAYSFHVGQKAYALYNQPWADDENTHIVGYSTMLFKTNPVQYMGPTESVIAALHQNSQDQLASKANLEKAIAHFELGSEQAKPGLSHIFQAQEHIDRNCDLLVGIHKALAALPANFRKTQAQPSHRAQPALIP